MWVILTCCFATIFRLLLNQLWLWRWWLCFLFLLFILLLWLQNFLIERRRTGLWTSTSLSNLKKNKFWLVWASRFNVYSRFMYFKQENSFEQLRDMIKRLFYALQTLKTFIFQWVIQPPYTLLNSELSKKAQAKSSKTTQAYTILTNEKPLKKLDYSLAGFIAPKF